MAMNKGAALALVTAALGGGLLFALSKESKAEPGVTPLGELPLEDLGKNPGDYYPDIADPDLIIFYNDMTENPNDYNREAIIDMILTLDFRGYKEESATLYDYVF